MKIAREKLSNQVSFFVCFVKVCLAGEVEDEDEDEDEHQGTRKSTRKGNVLVVDMEWTWRW